MSSHFRNAIGSLTFVFLLLSATLARAADFLVASDGPPNNGKLHGVLRYNGETGAFVGQFISMSRPFGMTYGPDGNLYVGNLDTSSINRYNGTTGAFISTFVNSGSGGLGIPWDMAFGPDGNLYVATTEGASPGILRYNGSSGAFMSRLVDAPSWGLTFGPDGSLYASNQGVRRYSAVDGSYLDDFVAPNYGGFHLKFGTGGDLFLATVTPGVARFDGSSGAFLGDFAVPPGYPNNPIFGSLEVTFGPDGNLYVGNALNSGVLRFDGSTGAFIDQFIPLGSGGLDQPRSTMFMVPEPQIILWGALGALVMSRRRLPLISGIKRR